MLINLSLDIKPRPTRTNYCIFQVPLQRREYFAENDPMNAAKSLFTQQFKGPSSKLLY